MLSVVGFRWCWFWIGSPQAFLLWGVSVAVEEKKKLLLSGLAGSAYMLLFFFFNASRPVNWYAGATIAGSRCWVAVLAFILRLLEMLRSCLCCCRCRYGCCCCCLLNLSLGPGEPQAIILWWRAVLLLPCCYSHVQGCLWLVAATLFELCVVVFGLLICCFIICSMLELCSRL